MIKVSLFSGSSEAGPTVIPLFTGKDAYFEKTASTQLLPDVVKYIAGLRPSNNSQYVLVNALGAEEWWGSNVNADGFPEPSLIHRPEVWSGNPTVDSIRSKDWAYGFPTFYNAHAFAHHKNKNPDQAYGDVELTTWHEEMKRVELVVKVDKDKCEKFGGLPVWDKLKAGQFIDVSMGCKVPWDRCTICTDMVEYRKALATFDKSKHKHPGMAVLEYHKNVKKIRGISITRDDYCDDMKLRANKILPDGRKVYVHNDFPRFFDISFVFIGADRTAKVMMKIAGAGSRGFWDLGSSAATADNLGYVEDQEKTASDLSKAAKLKKSEMDKEILPIPDAVKAVPILARSEEDLPDELLNSLGMCPQDSVLSTLSGMGMILRPREFQRITIIQMGGGAGLADHMDRLGLRMPEADPDDTLKLSPNQMMPDIGRMLMPFFQSRTALEPNVTMRVLMMRPKEEEKKASSSHSPELLHKIGAAYAAYRQQVPDLMSYSQVFLAKLSADHRSGIGKVASAEVHDVFSPLTVIYAQQAFLDERGPRQNDLLKSANTANVRGDSP